MDDWKLPLYIYNLIRPSTNYTSLNLGQTAVAEQVRREIRDEEAATRRGFPPAIGDDFHDHLCSSGRLRTGRYSSTFVVLT